MAPASTSTTSTRAGSSFRVPGLDGIRALAVGTVIVFHLVPGTLVGGYLGVDIFFVVSGFLITTLLLRERDATGRISLRGFWGRRARRLLPALGLLLIVCSTVALALGGDALVGIAGQVLGAATFSSNWLFIAQGSSYFDDTLPELFRNLWSLAVEEQFYLLWPLLVVLVLVRVPVWARLTGIGALALASAAWMALAYSPDDPTRVYYGTDTHAFGLAIGAFLAVLAAGRGIQAVDEVAGPGRVAKTLAAIGGFAALAGLVALAVVMSGDTAIPYLGGLAGVAVLSAVAIGALLLPRSPVASLLDLAPLRWIGLRSYGLYLWHWPVFVLLGTAYPDWPREGVEAWALGGIALVITVIAAALSYRFVEQPVRRLGFGGAMRAILDVAPRTARAFAAIIGMIATVALAAGTGVAIGSDPGRGQAQIYIEAGQDAVAEPDPTPVAQGEGVELATGGQIFAIGDSVMLAAAPALKAQFPGIRIDAQVSRSMYSAPDLVRKYRNQGKLREVLVLALGTNGPIERATLDQVRKLLGPERLLVLVNAQAPRGWIKGVNAELSSFARAYRNVELANWHDAIQPHLDQMASDRVHFGPFGAKIFTASVQDALRRLAELPPLRDDATALRVPVAE